MVECGLISGSRSIESEGLHVVDLRRMSLNRHRQAALPRRAAPGKCDKLTVAPSCFDDGRSDGQSGAGKGGRRAGGIWDGVGGDKRYEKDLDSTAANCWTTAFSNIRENLD